VPERPIRDKENDGEDRGKRQPVERAPHSTRPCRRSWLIRMMSRMPMIR
jgi:hypothetical protein